MDKPPTQESETRVKHDEVPATSPAMRGRKLRGDAPCLAPPEAIIPGMNKAAIGQNRESDSA